MSLLPAGMATLEKGLWDGVDEIPCIHLPDCQTKGANSPSAKAKKNERTKKPKFD